MKRVILLVGLVGLIVTGVAMAVVPPSPYVAFHNANWSYNVQKHARTVWIQVDSVGNGLGTTTHVYFRTKQVSQEVGGPACATSGHNGPDYVEVSDYLIAQEHQGSMMVPITICGNDHVGNFVLPDNDKVGLELYNPDAHTHLGLSEATLTLGPKN